MRASVLILGVAALVVALPSVAKSQTTPAGGDQFPGVAIDALPFTSLANTEGATTEAGEPLLPNLSATLWFHFTASSTEAVGIELGQAGVTPGAVTVYTGSTLTTLTMVDSGSTSSPGPWAAVFPVKAGVTYYIQIATGQFMPPSAAKLTLAIRAGTRPYNDVFPGREITAEQFEDVVDTTFATLDEQEASLLGGTVWYHFTGPPGGATIQADTFGTPFASGLSVEDQDNLELPGSSRGMRASCGATQVTVVSVAAGESVWFQVGSQGFPGSRGLLNFHFQYVEPGTVPLCPAEQPPLPIGPPDTGSGTANSGDLLRSFPAGLLGVGSWLLVTAAMLGAAAHRLRGAT